MDQRLRAINADLSLRIVVTQATFATREACRRQHAEPSEKVLLGRILSAASTMASLAKGEHERLRIQMIGRGPVAQVLADAHGDGRIRACVKQPLARTNDMKAGAHLLSEVLQTPDNPWSIGALLSGRGTITVVRDLGLPTPYEGTSALVSGEIDEDLEHYLNQSEQLPSALACETILDHHNEVMTAVGVLVQSFPGADPAGIQAIRERLRGRSLCTLLTHPRPLEDLIGFVLGGEEFSVMDRQSVEFSCPCGPQRALAVLTALGADDLEALAHEQEITAITCNFCGKVEDVSSRDVLALAQNLRAKSS